MPLPLEKTGPASGAKAKPKAAKIEGADSYSSSRMAIPMAWNKRIIRSPVLLQTLVAALRLATKIVRNEGRKKPKK